MTREYGSWAIRDVPVRWQLNGQPLFINAKECRVQDSLAFEAKPTLSGDWVMSQAQEYDERLSDGTVRASFIRDAPMRIELSFPRLPNDFLLQIRQFRSFHRAFQVELDLFDAADNERLITEDRTFWYMACGGIKPGTLELWVDGVATSEGFTANLDLGYVRFASALPVGTVVEARYVWAPFVTILGQVDTQFRAGIARAESALTFVLQQYRRDEAEVVAPDPVSRTTTTRISTTRSTTTPGSSTTSSTSSSTTTTLTSTSTTTTTTTSTTTTTTGPGGGECPGGVNTGHVRVTFGVDIPYTGSCTKAEWNANWSIEFCNMDTNECDTVQLDSNGYLEMDLCPGNYRFSSGEANALCPGFQMYGEVEFEITPDCDLDLIFCLRCVS